MTEVCVLRVLLYGEGDKEVHGGGGSYMGGRWVVITLVLLCGLCFLKLHQI
jgi:hypothetical protein